MLTKSEYERDRFVRYGRANPERVESALWHQLINGDHKAARQFGHASYEGHWSRLNADRTSAYRDRRPGPRWNWGGRYGYTATDLPDGRIIFVAGTVEDFYDPDFCIYNDVVVIHQNGAVEIYCYPAEVFPPTDFHTATRVGTSLYLIGGLGYEDLRRPGETPVLQLDLQTFEITVLAPEGHPPGWIYEHDANYDADDHVIEITSGKTVGSDRRSASDFEHAVVLDLETVRWH